MTNKMESIKLPESIKKDYEVINPRVNSEVLSNLSKINIFIGPNNSGKSQLVRELARTSIYEYLTRPNKLKILQDLVSKFKQQFINILTSRDILDYNDLKELLDSMDELTFYSSGYDILIKLKQLKNIIENMKESNSYKVTSRFAGNVVHQEVIREIKKTFEKIFSNEIDTITELSSEIKFTKTYIPILRGLRDPIGPIVKNRPQIVERIREVTGGIDDSIYKLRNHSDYFPELVSKQPRILDVFSGLSIYERNKKLTLAPKAEREAKKEFEAFLSNRFFDDKNVEITSLENSDVVAVNIDNEEFPIHKLGDGIQSIIINTYPLFNNRGNNQLVFIEEPEMFIHPGLQRVLMDTFINFEQAQFFITSHSNHFLDLTLDYEKISVFKVEKKAKSENKTTFTIENLSNEDINILESLGVRNSSVFLSNSAIWVEGITDRMYIRKWLGIWQKAKKNEDKKFKIYDEDRHYSFIEYSGKNLAHWSFLDKEDDTINVKKITNSNFLITDLDDEKKNIAFYDGLEKILGNNFLRLKRREIENYISSDVLSTTISDYEEMPSGQATKIFNYDSFGKDKLGQYLNEKLTEGKGIIRRRGGYADKYGRLKNKTAFCKKALGYTKTIDDLSEDSKKLCEQIYDFIKKNN